MPVFLPLYPSIQMLYFPVQYSHLRQLLLTHFEWPQSTLYCCRWRRKQYLSPRYSVFSWFPKRFLTLLCPDMSDHPRRSLSSIRLSFPVPLLRKQSRFRGSLLHFRNKCRPGICCPDSVLPYQWPHHLLSYQRNRSCSGSGTAMLQS